MKMQICGIEITEGVSKKTSKAYAMGRLHTLIPLAPPHGEGNVAKGLVGTTYECDVNLLRKVEHLPFPVMAEVDVQAMQRFGERTELVIDVRPVEVVKKAA